MIFCQFSIKSNKDQRIDERKIKNRIKKDTESQLFPVFCLVGVFLLPLLKNKGYQRLLLVAT